MEKSMKFLAALVIISMLTGSFFIYSDDEHSNRQKQIAAQNINAGIINSSECDTGGEPSSKQKCKVRHNCLSGNCFHQTLLTINTLYPPVKSFNIRTVEFDEYTIWSKSTFV